MANTASPSRQKFSESHAEVLMNLFQQIERIDSEFPLNYSICLVHIAMNEGMSLTQLSEKTGLGLSTISRIVGALSDFRPNGQAYGLIDLKISPKERRRKELSLTPKGWVLMRGLGTVLDTYRAADHV